MVYCDVFRAIPAIIVIYLVVFGTIAADIPVISNLSPTWLGLLALTLTYTAYVSEVFRAGLMSIHPSQGAAARSLLSEGPQTLRTVLVPQAVRRVIPPLLNDFIGLQKDTAPPSIAGIPEAFQVSTYWQSFPVRHVSGDRARDPLHHRHDPAGSLRRLPRLSRRQASGGSKLMAFLEIDEVHKSYGEHEVLKGVTLERRAARGRVPDRCVRLRQVHPAALRQRVGGPSAPARSGSRVTALPAPAST